ncbi:preprotein translocase subunit YajC [Longispora sp. K20-0274]|uniref:preprotein translocase subunit YajC n=1 Tax=Longispora sp. K20-0274 TaxID=3088255 RepID=UPI00399A99C0
MLLSEGASGGSSLFPLILFGALIVGMYFLLIRPQQKRRREMAEQQRNIGIGDEIVTIGGLYGTVVAMDDETMTLRISEGVTAKYARQAFGRLVTPQDGSNESIADESGDGDSAK